MWGFGSPGLKPLLCFCARIPGLQAGASAFMLLAPDGWAAFPGQN